MRMTHDWQVAGRRNSLEEEDEADDKEQQNNEYLQEEGSQNSILIIGVGMRVRPGLQSHSHALSLPSAGICRFYQCCLYDYTCRTSSRAFTGTLH